MGNAKDNSSLWAGGFIHIWNCGREKNFGKEENVVSLGYVDSEVPYGEFR